MRILALVVMAAALMTATPWANAKGSSGGGSGGGYGKGGGGGGAPLGVQGTITGVGSRGFVITVDGDTKTEGKSDGKPKMWQVLCNSTTKFVADGKDVSPSVIKVGLHVGVLGGASSQTEIMATTVNIGMPGKGK